MLLIIFLNLFIKSPNERLKNYLEKNNFVYNSDSELLYETNSLESFENNEIDTYKSITYNYNNSTFYEINRFKEDGYENSYNLSFDIINGTLSGDYKKENKYDTWYIESIYDSVNHNYTCNTNGYKGMIEYCDILKEKINEFESTIYNYLDGSKTSDYYIKKWNHKKLELLNSNFLINCIWITFTSITSKCYIGF